MSYFDYDPEVPAGFQDADLEQAAYEAEGRRLARLHRAGICTHGWRLGHGHKYTAEQVVAMRADGRFPDRPTDTAPLAPDSDLCLDCGQRVAVDGRD